MKADQVKVAVIGAGYWGKNLVRNFAELGALACVLETDPQTRERMAKAYPQVEFKTGLEPILADPAINAVAIATPAATHADLTTTCLNAGKHVYVEKPLCLDVESGMTLVALAEERERVLMVGHLLHYHPAVIKLKELIQRGRLGKLQYIHSNRLNLGKVRREENILWSFAPHDISVILSLTGEMPDEVGAFGGNYLQSQVADVTVSTMSFPSGVRAHIYVSWLYPYKEQRLVVVGSEGMAVFNDTSPDKKLTLYSHTIHWEHGSVPVPQKVEPEVVEIGQAEPLRAECQHFLDSVAQGQAPLTDGHEGLRVLRVLDRCQQSLNLPGTVQLRGESNMGLAQDGDYNVHSTAQVDPGCSIGQGTKIWHFSHVLGGSTIGDECNIGQNVVIGPKARIGSGCKIQNNVSVYQGVILEDHVFCGPSMVFTNVVNPRAHISRRHEFQNTLVREGATLGANCTIVCGHSIGRYAMVGAGAVVTKDVPDYAVMVGNPARQKGWICACGVGLEFGPDGKGQCRACGQAYVLADGQVSPA